MTTETERTPLDEAHLLMERAAETGPEAAADSARLRFYECLADAELLVLLAEEPEGDDPLRPQMFELEDGEFLMCFDTEERLAAFTEAPAPYAALPGRVIVAMLAGQAGLGLNLGVAPSSFLMPPEAVEWLADLLGDEPEDAEGLPERFMAPGHLPEPLLLGLADRLSRMGGFAAEALLSAVQYDDGRRGHLLAFVAPRPGAEPALAKAVAEALTFSGIEAGEIDVTFLPGDLAATQRMRHVARRFSMPPPAAPAAPERIEPKAPGSDPDRPPILR